ncbi:transcriptional attenuator, LytR family [Geosporobacter subterraneus DSM 17957]|uniref:Transcriptional attenuator, LytR family n=1 Tax=Geosporobacter subterraneus DSM 17957 TaxID=1121919 RepID=A0A1M6FHP2_9FIRM|nr:LCP family protein [Geosporobacter subterraneus]SHI97271.1 transcriptional attenuator, LytR family [Geosporobacter subterraneus DSM 17957]
MKPFLKAFLIAFVCFIVALGAGFAVFSKIYQAPDDLVVSKDDQDDIVDSESEQPGEVKEKTELEKLVDSSNRINIALLGMEGPRTDTIVFASFDPDRKRVDMISIPRDTYYVRPGRDNAAKKKINSVYGDEGVQGTMKAISDILAGVPVHHHIKVTYTGVERIIDSLGGVKVNVPMDMEYDDPYAVPELHIRIKKGVQVLDGKQAMSFLRFRQNNNGTGYPDGDLGRIRAQQQFMQAAWGKALGFRLPVVANTVFKYIDTSMDLGEILVYVKNAVGITKEDLKTYSLPGKSTEKGISYFLHNPDQVQQLMLEIYSTEESL